MQDPALFHTVTLPKQQKLKHNGGFRVQSRMLTGFTFIITGARDKGSYSMHDGISIYASATD